MAPSDGSDLPLGVGIDLGTSGPKVGVFTAEGALLGQATRHVTTVRGDRGRAEQDPDVVWQAVCDAIREAVSAAHVAPERIAAIGVDAQYSSIVPVAADGSPTGPLVTWMDTRGASHNRTIYERAPEALVTWLDVCGMVPLPSGSDSLAHLLYLQNERPEIHERTAAYVEPCDFVTAMLTGRPTASRCSVFMMLLTDNRDGAPLEWHPDLVRVAGVDRSRLPPLLELDDAVGRVRAGVAADLGLSSDTLVFPGVNDTQIGGLATGSLSGRHAGVCIGTTSVLMATLASKRLDAGNQLASMPSPLGGHMLMAEAGNGGRVLDHVLRYLLPEGDVGGPVGGRVGGGLGGPVGGPVYDGLEQAVAASPPGAGGVLLLPWFGGALAPVDDAKMRGGFLGVSLTTRRADLVRATLEGLAHNLRWVMAPAERLCGFTFDRVVFSGGGARSAAWSRILADVLDRPVHQLADPAHANGRAAALFALSHVGSLASDDIGSRMPVAAVFEPSAPHRGRYDAQHEQFVAAFTATQPISHALRRSAR